MNEKTFVFVFLTLFLVVTIFIAAFNYTVDSHYLFSRTHLLETAADDLLSGKMISEIENVNDRYLHKQIVEKMVTIPDTIVLGSSRSFLLRASCLGLEKTGIYFNHSVVGATLKDYIALIGVYKRKGVLPLTIIIEVTPWLFDKGSKTSLFSKRWLSIADEYYSIMNFLNYNTPTLMPLYKNIQYKILKTKALISYSETIEHIKSLLSGGGVDYRIANCMYADVSLKMPDGSLCYPFNKRAQYNSFSEKVYRNFSETMKEHIHQQSLQTMFIDLIDFLDKNNTQVVFFLPPYNPYAYHEINKDRALHYILDYEQMTRDLAESKKIPVIGSYNPQISHLSHKDFFDAMHINSDLAIVKVFRHYRKVLGKNTYPDKDSKAGVETVEPTCLEYHWLEAEHADTIVIPLTIANDGNASEGKYVYSANGTGNQYTPGPIMATYTVNISHSGKYIIWGLVSITNSRDDSFFIEIDNGYDNLWEISLGSNWHWDAVNYRNRADPVQFTLFEGKHTIKVKLREDGTKLDKLLLTNNVHYVPSGKGGFAENQGYTGEN